MSTEPLPTILLKNATIITLDDQRPIIEKGDLAIGGSKILAVGTAPNHPSADEIVDLSGHVVMPGFWNSHTHAAMTFTRSIGDDLPLDVWFNEKIWIAESGLTEEDVYWGTQLAAAEMIRGGTMGFADHYFHMDRVAEVVACSGLKALLATALFGSGNEVGLNLDDSIWWATEHQGHANGRIHTVLGPHSPYICPPEFLRKTAKAASRHGLGLHIHLAESAEQVARSHQEHGRSPVAHLQHLGLFDVPTIAAHCIAVDENDLDILAQHQVVPVQCPRCHLKMSMGTTPVAAMLDRGLKVALGTDGPASSNSLHMLPETQTATLIAKHQAEDPRVLAGDLPLRMATTHGALAMGFTNSGVLKEDFAADLIVFDFRAPHLQPCFSVVGNLLHAAHGGDLVHSMVDGRWLMRDRKLLTLDEAEIIRRASPMSQAMFSRGQTLLRRYKS